jgi:hypothetical protein
MVEFLCLVFSGSFFTFFWFVRFYLLRVRVALRSFGGFSLSPEYVLIFSMAIFYSTFNFCHDCFLLGFEHAQIFFSWMFLTLARLF